jgi:hypothetical protein
MSAQQLNLLSEPRARHDDPETSKAAAAKVKPGNPARLLRVAEIVDAKGLWGATADEVYACTADGSPRSTWHGAVSRAAEAGLIVPHPKATKRMSQYNTLMRVYVHPRFAS